MKLFYLLIILLLSTSCSNEIAEKIDTGGNTIRIGEIGTFANGAGEWVWKTGDKLSVKVNGSTAEYTYTAAGKWSCGNTSFTKEAVGMVATNGVSLSFGESKLVENQTAESDYRRADYMTGTGSLDVITISGNLTHQNTDIVIDITEGEGWNGMFNSAMADVERLSIHKTYAGGKYAIRTYRQGSTTFRAILPPAYVSKGDNVLLGYLTLGSNAGTPQSLRGKSAAIIYTNNEPSVSGKRFTLSVKLDASLNLMITDITVKSFAGVDVPGELKP